MALLWVEPLPPWINPLCKALQKHLPQKELVSLKKELQTNHEKYRSNAYRVTRLNMETFSYYAYQWIQQGLLHRFHKIFVPLLQAQHKTWSSDLCEALCLHGLQLDNFAPCRGEEKLEQPYTAWITQVLYDVSLLYQQLIPNQCWAHGSKFFFEGYPLQEPRSGLWYWGWIYRTSRTDGYLITRLCYTKVLSGTDYCFLLAFTAEAWRLLSVVRCTMKDMATITFPGTRFAQVPAYFWNLVPLSEALQDGKEVVSDANQKLDQTLEYLV